MIESEQGHSCCVKKFKVLFVIYAFMKGIRNKDIDPNAPVYYK